MKQLSLFDDEQIGTEQSWFADALDTLNLVEMPGWPDLFGDSIFNLNRPNSRRAINVLSLFSGAGGLDIGFHDAGFKIVECNEIEKDFAATLSYNSKHRKLLCDTKIVCMDINDYNPSFDRIDFIIGGPPCQTFSAAGARAAGVNGTDDARGNLFKQYTRILNELEPCGFLFENVYRIVGAQGGKPWRQIQESFRDVGYKLFWRILDAADYGVPQFRERLIIVGLKEGSYKFPYPTHGPDSQDQRSYYTSQLAISGVASKVQGTTIGGRHGHLLNDIPPGLNYSFYTERMKHPTPFFGWRSKFSDYLYKADPETPVRTIKAQGGQYTGPFHWENRTFTIEELKRLQTFPDNYVINGNRQKMIHQLGNSVPPQLSRILALSIAQQVFDIKFPFKLKVLPDTFKLGFRARKNKLTKIYAKKASDAIAKIKIDNYVTGKILESIKGYFILSDNLVLQSSNKDSNWNCYFEHKISKGKIIIQLWDKTNNNNLEYQYTIKPYNGHQSNSPDIELITMQSFSLKPYSITAIWKYLEILIKKHYHKDDLVQLFGYYQYSNNYMINFKCTNKNLEEHYFWNVLTSISHGDFVGKITSLAEISEAYKIEKDVLISQLQHLKKLGYEIRNNNTNKQIKDDCLLVPYSFPSLNERSLQRLTEL